VGLKLGGAGRRLERRAGGAEGLNDDDGRLSNGGDSDVFDSTGVELLEISSSLASLSPILQERRFGFGSSSVT
jgi:hypothetical protein